MLKVLCTRCAVRRVRVLANQVASPAEGEQVFRRLLALSERFLNLGLDYVGAVPKDPAIGRAVMRGEPVITAYPRCPASLAIGNLAETLAKGDARDDPEAHTGEGSVHGGLIPRREGQFELRHRPVPLQDQPAAFGFGQPAGEGQADAVPVGPRGPDEEPLGVADARAVVGHGDAHGAVVGDDHYGPVAESFHARSVNRSLSWFESRPGLHDARERAVHGGPTSLVE